MLVLAVVREEERPRCYFEMQTHTPQWRRSRRARSYLHSRRANRGSPPCTHPGMERPFCLKAKNGLIIRPFIMRSDSELLIFMFRSEKKMGLLMQSDFAKSDGILVER